MSLPESKFFSTAMLGIALSTTVTAATSASGTFILKMHPAVTSGPRAESRGAEVPPLLHGDSLAVRYDAARLAPYEASRREMHKLMLTARKSCQGWTEPALNLGMDGQLEMQWWRGNKSLTLIVDHANISFLQAWGEDIHAEMADGDGVDADAFLALWSWLQE